MALRWHDARDSGSSPWPCLAWSGARDDGRPRDGRRGWSGASTTAGAIRDPRAFFFGSSAPWRKFDLRAAMISGGGSRYGRGPRSQVMQQHRMRQ